MALSRASDLWQRQLLEVQAALDAVLGGGTYTLGTRIVGPADEAELISLEELYELRTARQAILEGLQEYEIGGRTYKRPDLGEIQRRISQLNQTRARRTSGGIRQRQGTPLR